jgi:hypothetical protein
MRRPDIGPAAGYVGYSIGVVCIVVVDDGSGP